jgi:hypothetical protein
LTAGNKLLLEAIDLGAFAGELYAGLRQRVNLARGKPEAFAGALMAGVGWLVESGRLSGVPGDVVTTFNAMKSGLPTLLHEEADRLTRKRPAALFPGDVRSEAGEQYHSAEWLSVRHGISKSRLSEGKRENRVRWRKAGPGYTDFEGGKARVLYNVADALRHCSPKHVKGKNRADLG